MSLCAGCRICSTRSVSCPPWHNPFLPSKAYTAKCLSRRSRSFMYFSRTAHVTWLLEQSRRRNLLPASQRCLDLADPDHEIGGGLHAVNRTAELVLGVADDRFHGGAVERRGRLTGEINLRRTLGIVAGGAGRLARFLCPKARHF